MSGAAGEGRFGVEIPEIYDGISVWWIPEVGWVNAWNAQDSPRRWRAAQDWINARQGRGGDMTNENEPCEVKEPHEPHWWRRSISLDWLHCEGITARGFVHEHVWRVYGDQVLRAKFERCVVCNAVREGTLES